MVLQPIFVVVPNQEKATMVLPRGKNMKKWFIEFRWVMRDRDRPRDFPAFS